MPADLKITQLRHFVWVAELNSFHAAAEKAYRSQPAISLSIRDLEDKLGQALFEKRNIRAAKAELTAFGRHFIPKAKELIDHHDRVSQDMFLLAKHKTGHLRLASLPSIANQILPELLMEFLQGSPDLHISFYDDNSDAILNMVERQQVDFGIGSLFVPEAHRDKIFTPIWEDNMGVVCPKDHPLASSRELHWSELQKYKLIGNGTTLLLKNTTAEPLVYKAQFYISNMISLLAMLEAGLGITTLPRYAFPDDRTKLCFIPISEPVVTRQVGIIRLKNRSINPAAQTLIDFLFDKFNLSKNLNF